MGERRKPGRKSLTVRINADLVARLKRVARDAAGMPLYASVAGIVEAGIAAECDRIEKILTAAYAGSPPLGSTRRIHRLNSTPLDRRSTTCQRT